ncbi:element excision factor XisH family protein [Spirosoma litoris]
MDLGNNNFAGNSLTMPAKDAYHDIVRTALEKESWLITHDPFRVVLGRRKGYIDLAAEKLLAAQRGTQKIAVEIKSFLGASTLDEFEDALGQFLIYKVALENDEPDRQLYLAVPVSIYTDFFDDSFFAGILKRFAVQLLIFDEDQQTIVQWID